MIAKGIKASAAENLLEELDKVMEDNTIKEKAYKILLDEYTSIVYKLEEDFIDLEIKLEKYKMAQFVEENKKDSYRKEMMEMTEKIQKVKAEIIKYYNYIENMEKHRETLTEI